MSRAARISRLDLINISPHWLHPPIFPSPLWLHWWGGASSKLGGVAALYAGAGGPSWYATMGATNAAWMAYFTAPDNGCRSAQAYVVNATPERGGWTEDAWLDVLHNMVDAADAGEGVC